MQSVTVSFHFQRLQGCVCGGFQSLWGWTCLICRIQFSLTHALLGDFFWSFSSNTHFPGRWNDNIQKILSFRGFFPHLFRYVPHCMIISSEFDVKTRSSFTDSSVLLKWQFKSEWTMTKCIRIQWRDSAPLMAMWYCLLMKWPECTYLFPFHRLIWWCVLIW